MKIIVIDLETTGFLDEGGHIVEVGIVSLDLDNGKIITLLDYVCHEKGMTKKEVQNSWIVRYSTLTLEQIRFSIDFETLKPKIQAIIDRYNYITSYNQAFDLNFLRSRGIRIPAEKVWQDPMLVLTPIMRIPHGYYEHKYPSVEEAYKFLFGKELKEAHRAADDAQKEAQIIFEMFKKNYLKLNSYEHKTTA